MSMAILWFVVLAVLWAGFLVLDGFDFGVGALHGVVGRDETGRRVAINAIGPVWDGNEVWLIVAGAGTFAAFPAWYATMFSGLYLALVLVLVALILRGVAFEFRGKRDDRRWRRTWDAGLVAGSVAAPLLIGVGLGDLLAGLPIDAQGEYTGTFVDVLTGYGLAMGVTVLLLCLLHGAAYLALKTGGDVRERAAHLAGRLGPLAALAVIVTVIWTRVLSGGSPLATLAQVVAVLAALGAVALRLPGRGADRRPGRDGWAFVATSATLGALVLSLFATLYPRVMVSSAGPADDLTVAATASSSYTLTLMAVVTAIFFPIVLAYQAWTYLVFRRRITRADLESAHPPAAPAAPTVP
jgi:cytochrome d ubiquinol oxidase subunit II